MKNFINLPAFLISLAIGLLFVYLTEPPHKVVYVYPTPENIGKIEYRDKANNCFEYNMQTIKCPSDKSKINTIPMQD
jgi:hypothetical protein